MLEKSVLRDATIQDLEAIIQIYNSYVGNGLITADTTYVTLEERIPWFHNHHSDTRPLWVLEYEQQIIAWISLSDFYGRPAYRSTAEVSIYIHQDFTGHRIGQFLLQKMMESCLTFNVDTLLAFIFKQNAPSIKLFSRFGFEEWGNLPEVAELNGQLLDLVILGKKL